METIRISVTEDDIANGEKFDSNYCPIALAVKRVLPRATKIEVYAAQINVYFQRRFFKSKKEIYNMPWHAAFFIEDFDLGQPVKPFEFESDLIFQKEI